MFDYDHFNTDELALSDQDCLTKLNTVLETSGFDLTVDENTAEKIGFFIENLINVEQEIKVFEV